MFLLTSISQASCLTYLASTLPSTSQHSNTSSPWCVHLFPLLLQAPALLTASGVQVRNPYLLALKEEKVARAVARAERDAENTLVESKLNAKRELDLKSLDGQHKLELQRLGSELLAVQTQHKLVVQRVTDENEVQRKREIIGIRNELVERQQVQLQHVRDELGLAMQGVRDELERKHRLDVENIRTELEGRHKLELQSAAEDALRMHFERGGQHERQVRDILDELEDRHKLEIQSIRTELGSKHLELQSLRSELDDVRRLEQQVPASQDWPNSQNRPEAKRRIRVRIPGCTTTTILESAWGDEPSSASAQQNA